MKTADMLSQFLLKAILRIIAGSTLAIVVVIDQLNLKPLLTDHNRYTEKEATIILCLLSIAAVIILYDFFIKKLIQRWQMRSKLWNYTDEGGYFHTKRHSRSQ